MRREGSEDLSFFLVEFLELLLKALELCLDSMKITATEGASDLTFFSVEISKHALVFLMQVS